MKTSTQRPVTQRDCKTGEIIKVWESPAMAGRALKIPSSDIASAANGIQRTAKGFGWTYDTPVVPFTLYQYDIYNTLIAVYDSVLLASEATGLSKGLIRIAAKIGSKSGQFIWRLNPLPSMIPPKYLDDLRDQLIDMSVLSDSGGVHSCKAFNRQITTITAAAQHIFPDFESSHGGSELVYRVTNKLMVRPQCVICSGHVAFNNSTTGYSRTCGFECSVKDPMRIKARLATWNTNYEFGHPSSQNRTSYQFNSVNDPGWLLHQHHVLKKTLTTISSELGISDVVLGRYYRKHDIAILTFQQSTGEREVAAFISELGLDIEVGNRSKISPLELDIYIPELNVGIEYCGLYWHNEIHKIPLYHLNKLSKCEEAGIRLITIFEDEWKHRRDVVEQKLRNILGKSDSPIVFARKCMIVDVPSSLKKSFFAKHHIQGDGPGSITYGLLFDGNVIAAMTFIAQREGKYVLNRYASSCSVPGGFSKLLAHFKKQQTWNEIVSFADRRWSTGSLYQQCGFTLDKALPPDYSYVVGDVRVHKFNFRHSLLANKLDQYDPNLSESENCNNHGLYKIWNCGLLRYVVKNI